MKIAWFTPFSVQSAIGRASAAIVAELSKDSTVDVWHCESSGVRKTAARTIQFSRALAVDLTALEAYDVVVYNFGNHLPFHREIFHLSQRFPGVCILHDFVMHHFFAAYYLEDLKNPEGYIEAMGRLYGDGGRAVAAGAVGGQSARVWETDDVVKYPLFEDTIRGAYGVIAHSHFLTARIAKSYCGPVACIPLAYDVVRPVLPLSRQQLDVPEDRMLLVTVGHANRNKRIHAVIDALGRVTGAADKVVYAVLGPCDSAYRTQLLDMARSKGLESAVRLLGYTPDETLQAYLTHADFCVNLRFPAIEGGSASLIEEMLYGKAVVVTDTGIYRELPDDCVIKISPENELQELAPALRNLIENGKLRQQLGDRARRFAEEEFHPANYARAFLKFVREARSAKPLLQFADRIATQMTELGIHAGMEIVDTVSREASALFGNEK
jgi:glycosyltransferase involved in cell wall biosynthesis